MPNIHVRASGGRKHRGHNTSRMAKHTGRGDIGECPKMARACARNSPRTAVVTALQGRLVRSLGAVSKPYFLMTSG